MEKLYRPLILSLIVGFSLYLLSGYWPIKEGKTVFYGVAMTVPYQVAIRQSLSLEEESVIKDRIANLFDQTHQVFNKFNPDSELSSLNRWPREVPFRPSPPLLSLLNRTNDFVILSQGLFDPTIETEDEEAIGWNHLIFDGDHVIKTDERTALDLGGIAKGTTIDNLLHAMNGLGYPSVLVEWGGDFAVSTKNSSEAPWKIALFDPDGNEEIVELWKGGLATSGDYEQFWKEGEETYFHLYHPLKKGYLSQKSGQVMSVSVLAETAEEADALATIFLLLEREEEGKKFLHSLKKILFKVWWKTRG